MEWRYILSNVKKIESFNGVKGFLALSVFCGHTELFISMNMNTIGRWASEVFFLLSGFVLMYNHAKDSMTKLTIRTETKYAMKRVKKVYSLYIFTGVISIPLIVGKMYLYDTMKIRDIVDFLLRIITSIFLVQTWLPNIQAVNGTGWFIATLFFCYLFFNTIRKILMRQDRQKQTHIMMIIILIGMKSFLCFMEKFFDNECQYYDWFRYFSPYIRIFDFALGMEIAYFYLNYECYIKKFVSFFSAVGVVTFILSIYMIKQDYYYKFSILTDLLFSINGIVVILAGTEENCFLSRIFGNKYFIYFGSISQMFFLTHYVVISYGIGIHLLIGRKEYTWIDNVIIALIELIISVIVTKLWLIGYNDLYKRIIIKKHNEK